MEQQQSGTLGFREVDRHGQPVAPEADGADPEVVARSLRAPNPFIVVLWLVCAAMIAAGLGTLLRGPVSIGPMSNGLSLNFVLFTFAPHLVLMGFAALVVLLFWHAWQWQRRRG